MEHHEGWTITVDLVIQLDAIDLGIAFRVWCAQGLCSRDRRVRGRGGTHRGDEDDHPVTTYVLLM